MKKVSKKTKIITVATCFLILVGTVAFNVVTAPHVKKEVTPMSMDKFWIVKDSDNNGLVTKGDLIELEDVDYNKDEKTDRFRVMKTDGNRYTLMAVGDKNVGNVGYQVKTEDFDGKYGFSYRKSNIPSWCTHYFYSLPEYVQEAVIETEISQKMYKAEYTLPDSEDAAEACIGKHLYVYDSKEMANKAREYADEFKVNLTDVSEVNAGIHTVYLPSVEDIHEYLATDEQPYKFDELFDLEQSAASILLRSSVDGYADRVVFLNMATQNFGETRCNNEFHFFPMFTVAIE